MSEPTPPSNTPPPVLNTSPPPPNTPFVKKEFDEFKDKTTITHISKLKYDTVGNRKPIKTGFEFQLRQVKTKDIALLVLDCSIRKISDETLDGYQAKKGSIIFNCDQENLELKYHESRNSDEMKVKETSGETLFLTYFYEDGYYELEPLLLKQICDAKVLKVRIAGEKQYAIMDEAWCAEFQKYCRQFYNNAFDSSLYAEALVDEPKVEPKSGCFVATAAMGSYDDPAVQVLTKFRDAILLKCFIGRQSVHCYYAISPRIASWMRNKNWVCWFAKRFLILPASKIIAIILK